MFIPTSSPTGRANCSNARHGVRRLAHDDSDADRALTLEFDKLHLDFPFARSRMLRDMLDRQGHEINRKHAATLMRKKGIEALTSRWVAVSMEGRGCWRDNAFVERLGSTIKYEHVYLRAYDSVSDARAQLSEFIDFYNIRRPHSPMGKKTPNEFFFASLPTIQQAAQTTGFQLS